MIRRRRNFLRLTLHGGVAFSALKGWTMDKTAENQPTAISLRADVEAQDARQLVLRYELANASSGRIYLLGPPVRFGPHAVVQRHEAGAWVFHEGAHDVRLVCALLRPNLRTAMKLPVAVIPVESGTVHSGRIVLALPLMESHPYRPALQENAAALYSISRARLQVGWVPQRSGIKVVPLPLSDGSVIEQFIGAWGTPLQYVAEAVVPLSKVALRRQPDSFDRPMPAE